MGFGGAAGRSLGPARACAVICDGIGPGFCFVFVLSLIGWLGGWDGIVQSREASLVYFKFGVMIVEFQLVFAVGRGLGREE